MGEKTSDILWGKASFFLWLYFSMASLGSAHGSRSVQLVIEKQRFSFVRLQQKVPVTGRMRKICNRFTNNYLLKETIYRETRW